MTSENAAAPATLAVVVDLASADYTEPPCIAGDHYPNADGTACHYCGLAAEIVAPDELMAAWSELVATSTAEDERDRAADITTFDRWPLMAASE